MPTTTYARPTLPPDVTPVNLAPDGMGGTELTPQTRVLIVNRGTHPYVDKFDGRNYTVPPETVSEVAYEVAAHFRERSIIPGSRDPVSGKQEHYIAILGIDPPEKCNYLSAVEQQKADEAAEAIDRSQMDGADGDVRVVNTNAARARMVGRGRQVMQSTETNDGTASAPDALKAPKGGDAMKQIARDAAAKEQER